MQRAADGSAGLRRPPWRRRLARVLALALAVGVSAGLAAAVAGSSATVVPAPEPGQVQPQALEDGTPVLVAASGDGSALVLDARVAVSEAWTGVAGWCEGRAVILDRLSAGRWARDGRRQLPAGPGRAVARSGAVAPALARYDVEVAGAVLRVGERRPPDPDQAIQESRQFRLCPPAAVAVPPLPGEARALGDLPHVPDGWHRVRGTLVLDDLAAPRLCPPHGRRCDDPVALPPLLGSAVRPHASRLAGELAVRTEAASITHVWVPADTREMR